MSAEQESPKASLNPDGSAVQRGRSIVVAIDAIVAAGGGTAVALLSLLLKSRSGSVSNACKYGAIVALFIADACALRARCVLLIP